MELDPALASQMVITESLRVTRLLLAKAGIGEPDAIKILRDGLKGLPTRGEAGRFRRELGSKFVLETFGDREWMQVPLLPTTRIETNCRQVRLLVMEMRRQSFRCRRISETCLGEGESGFHPDSREMFQCSRVDSASKLEAGRLLHVSMETGTDIRAAGRLVVDSMTFCPVAMEICEVQGFPSP